MDTQDSVDGRGGGCGQRQLHRGPHQPRGLYGPRQSRRSPRPDLASTTFVSSATMSENLPCVTHGSLGAGTVCEASCVWTADGTACEAGSQAELVFRLTQMVATLTPAQGMPFGIRCLAKQRTHGTRLSTPPPSGTDLPSPASPSIP